MSSLPTSTAADKPAGDSIDLREQLCNGRQVGRIHEVQPATEQIAQLHGIMLDLDPHLYRPDGLAKGATSGARDFFDQTVTHWLARHPVLAQAEVRSTGTGLHVLIWFADPVGFDTDGRRQRWAGIVKAVQCILPIDPDQPGITALTRPLGSANSKNGAVVAQLKAGTPVPVAEVERLFEDLQRAPFRTIVSVLLGAEHVRPCPICQGTGSTLTRGDRLGFCYGSCGQVSLESIYDLFLIPRPAVRDSGRSEPDASIHPDVPTPTFVAAPAHSEEGDTDAKV